MPMKACLRESVQVVLTARDTNDRLKIKECLHFEPDIDGVENSLINIYEDVDYQEIEGFGGAFTEAGAVNLEKLSKAQRDEVLHAYFDTKDGLGYNLCRTHINSCDFSLGNYSYVETPGDYELNTFNIERDKCTLILYIKEAIKTRGSDIKIYSSPWSPPAWMKTTGQMDKGGKLKDECRDAWARYYAKYIKQYANEGIKIWGITVQNEAKAVQTWDSCVYTAEEERDFVKDYLGPVMEKEGLKDVKIMIWDHNKERIYERAKVSFSDPDSAKYIWGVGFHWYSGDHFEALSILHDAFPEKKLLFTEGCIVESGVQIGNWTIGERYGHDIIGDLNNWATGWVDWNMLLDENGGPNHADFYCDAPIIFDTSKAALNYQSSYYYIGHFSKYIKPGAVRIGFSRFTDKLETTAFKNPDGQIAVVVMNRTDINIPFILRCEKGLAKCESPGHSIITLIY